MGWRFPSSRTGERKRWYIPDDPAAAGLFDRDRYEGRLADERRLFYVALTQAEELLVLSFFGEHRGRKARPSQFLRELLSGETMKGEFRRIGEVRLLAVASARSCEDGLVVDCGQLLVYSECPRKYYLRYVCGFAPPIAPALGFGKVAHHVVCEMARRARLNALPSPSDAAAILRERFYLPFASRAQREAMLDALNRRLANYVRRHGADLARTLDVERRFEIPLDGACLRGRIDLLLRAAGPDPSAVETVDIKTAENRPPLPQHQNQLRLYAQAARPLGLNPVRLVIHDLDSEDGAAIPVEENPTELARFQEDMCRWVHGMSSVQFAYRRDRAAAWGTGEYACLC